MTSDLPDDPLQTGDSGSTAGPGHAIVRRLLYAYGTREAPPEGEHEPFVAEQDAREALLQLAIVLDQSYQEQQPIDADRLEHAMRMLAIAREYVTRLPLDENDMAGLNQTVVRLVRARQSSGLQG